MAPLGQTQTRNADEDLFPTRIYHIMSCPNKFLLKYSVDNVLCVGLAFLNTLYRPKTFIFNDTAQILIVRKNATLVPFNSGNKFNTKAGLQMMHFLT